MIQTKRNSSRDARPAGRLLLVLLVAASLLGSCMSMRGRTGHPMDLRGSWVLLPIKSYVETPQVGERVEAILSTLLRIRGIEQLENYADHLEPGRLPELDERRRFERALKWAKEREFDYLITGSVNEWQYKSGLEARPVVGLSLEIQSLETGEVLFTASGALTGWSRGSLSGTAQNLINDLLDQLYLEDL